MFRSFFSLCIFVWVVSFCFGQKNPFENRTYHLRSGLGREWNEFPLVADDSQLVIRFSSKKNIDTAALYMRQYDVKERWDVSLNGKKLGELTSDENDMMSYFNILPGTIITGENIFLIKSSSEHISDDVIVQSIILEERSVYELLSEARINVYISDGKNNSPIPCRITIVNSEGSLQQVYVIPNDSIAVRTGVLYTTSGKATFFVPSGSYKIYASRGFEYGVDSASITVTPGESITQKLRISQEVDTEGWISCDPHVHTFTYSGHGDATVRERLVTIAGEGLELPVITDHNMAVNIAPLVKNMGLNSFFVPVTGNEVTTKVGHFNVFPADAFEKLPDHRVDNWRKLSEQVADIKVIVLNHARDIHNGFRPFDPTRHISIAGLDLNHWKLPANSMEVINSGAQLTNARQLIFDWFGMMNRGIYLTPVGSSDSHDVSRYIIGQGRTYIRSSKDNIDGIDTAEIFRNIVDGKVIVSFGLLTQLMVNDKYGPGDLITIMDKMMVSLQVSGPSWTQASRVTLYANGEKIRESTITEKLGAGKKWKATWVLPRFRHDVYLVAIAEGPVIYRPFWPVAKPYQHSSGEWNPVVIGCTGAIWIDADKDGKKTSAYQYARSLWEISKGQVNVFLKKLSHFDKAVAIQAAAILFEIGIDIRSASIDRWLKKAAPQTRNGFIQFIKELPLQ